MSFRDEFLDMSARDRDARVFRIISLARLYELFEQKRNALVSPRKWDDPFENFILNSATVPRGGWFGQCRTRQRASDAMWRIYSPDKKAVRIRSTATRLLASLTPSTSEGRGFIGTVRYLPKRALMQFAHQAVSSAFLRNYANAARTLLVKRPAFRHEAEVRLLFHKHNGGKSEVFYYQVDPHALIDQLMLDPRLSYREFAAAKTELLRRTGYTGVVKRSLLYAPPPPLTPAT